MIEIRVDAPELGRLTHLPRNLRWALSRLLAREAEASARDMKGELAQQRIAATSLLINSVKADALDELTWQIGPHVEYDRYVLEGRQPGGKQPPWRAILDWMKVKRLGSDRASAWAIARAIQRRGIKGRNYLAPVADRTARRLETRGAAVVDEAIGRGDVG